MSRISSLFTVLLLVSALVCALSASCLNDCSQHGTCSSANTCVCDAGYLAIDCSVQSSMKPLQLIGGNYTTYWSISNGFFYHRIIAVTSTAGWAGVLFGAVDRMTNGRGHIVTLPSAFNGTVYDVYATAKHTPLFTNSIVLGAVGFAGKNTIDVSYYRPTATNEAHHYSIPEQPGVITNVSVAFQSQFFEFHRDNADYIQIDLAAVAAGQTFATL